jgi:DNA-binding FadR family transcriptional regulator
VFHRLASTSKKSFQVAEQILEVLSAGQLAEGDRLPTEREMIDQLGVSRTALREALSALQLAGYLGSRPGYGHYVRRIPQGSGREADSAEGLEAGLTVIEAIEARAALDLSVVCLAIKHASDEDLLKADALLAQMAECLHDGEYKRYALLSLDFHEALAAATGNMFLQHNVATFVDVVRRSAWVIARNYDPAKGAYSLDVHRQMVEGIRERNVDKAVGAVWAHYHEYPSLRATHNETAAAESAGEKQGSPASDPREAL